MSQDDFKKINELIRQCGRKFDHSMDLPSEDDIYACFENRATSKQLDSIQKALLNSNSFRNKFKYIIKEYQEFLELTNNNKLQTSDIILPEKLRHALNKNFSQSNYPQNTKLDKINSFFKPLQLVAASFIIVVISTIIIMSLSSSSPVLIKMVADVSVEKSELISVVTRGNSLNKTFYSSRDAAIFGFRNYLHYDSDKDIFIPHKIEDLNFITKLFTDNISLVDMKGEFIRNIKFNDNIPASDVITDIQIRSIDIKTFATYTSSLKSFAKPIQLDIDFNNSHFVVITYKLNNLYFVAGGTVIKN